MNAKRLVLAIALSLGVILSQAVALPATLGGTESASAHARCDRKTHDHWHWGTAHSDHWVDRYATRVVVNNGPDYTWVVAENTSHGYREGNKCYW